VIDFYEFLVGRRKMILPDPVTMLVMLGIDPTGPHEVEVVRLVER